MSNDRDAVLKDELARGRRSLVAWLYFYADQAINSPDKIDGKLKELSQLDEDDSPEIQEGLFENDLLAFVGGHATKDQIYRVRTALNDDNCPAQQWMQRFSGTARSLFTVSDDPSLEPPNGNAEEETED